MKKKVILLTGAAGFLGKNLLKHFVTSKHVIAIDYNKKKLLKLKKQFKDYHNKVDYFSYDITKKKNILKIKNFSKKKNYFIDVIINNAALNPSVVLKKNVRLAHESEIHQDFNVGILGSYLIIKEFIDIMAKNKSGKIINIGSDLSILSPDHEMYLYKNLKSLKSISYPIVKHGLVGLTKYFATFSAKDNISCNMISPGPINNDQPNFLKKKLIKKNPSKRLARVNEIVEVINFLINLKTNYLNGQNIIIDGGKSII